jgi:murein DD-endopeptidase MepM/ murein hydrolase activator NlpD
VKFRLTGEYGELSPVRNWKSHTGIDFGMAEGTELHSIGDGVINKVFDGSVHP